MAMQNFRKRGRIPEELEFECMPIAKRINLLSIGHVTSFEAESGSSSSDSQSPKSGDAGQPNHFLATHVPVWNGIQTDYAARHTSHILDTDSHHYAGHVLDADSHHYPAHLLGQDTITLDSAQFDPRRQNDSNSGRLARDGIHSSFPTVSLSDGDDNMDHSTFLPGFSGTQQNGNQMMTPEEYLAQMNAECNPHYIHVNALLFQMHQSRMNRNQ